MFGTILGTEVQTKDTGEFWSGLVQMTCFNTILHMAVAEYKKNKNVIADSKSKQTSQMTWKWSEIESCWYDRNC